MPLQSSGSSIYEFPNRTKAHGRCNTSDTDEGKPEPSDSERIGLGLSSTREETAFRVASKTRESHLAMYSIGRTGVQVCAKL